MDFAVCEAKRPGEPLFVGILRDITERKESERRVREEKERAESANRAKSEFLASMSHELRTPLNAILGFAQLMQIDQEEPLTETQQISVEHIKNGGDHLLEVLNEVLDLAKIEAGGVDLEMESVRVGALIGECVSLMAATADELGVKMTMDTALADDPTCVRADATRLKQVFLNLISNAAKYNRPNGSVTISSVAHKAGIQRVSVADTGIGVSDEQLDDLFKPFSRLAVADTEIEGTGIGLTITKRLVERMGGVIGVKSVPGEGSVFWVEMPLAD
jgi:signal transduction histidine kinase